MARLLYHRADELVVQQPRLGMSSWLGPGVPEHHRNKWGQIRRAHPPRLFLGQHQDPTGSIRETF